MFHRSTHLVGFGVNGLFVGVCVGIFVGLNNEKDRHFSKGVTYNAVGAFVGCSEGATVPKSSKLNCSSPPKALIGFKYLRKSFFFCDLFCYLMSSEKKIIKNRRRMTPNRQPWQHVLCLQMNPLKMYQFLKHNQI